MNDDQISRLKLLKKLKQHKELFCRNRIEFLGLSKNDKAIANEIDNCIATVMNMPPAQQQYEPVTAEDFAKTMSENSLYNFVAWHQEALTLMERQGFVICKKTI